MKTAAHAQTFADRLQREFPALVTGTGSYQTGGQWSLTVTVGGVSNMFRTVGYARTWLAEEEKARLSSRKIMVSRIGDGENFLVSWGDMSEKFTNLDLARLRADQLETQGKGRVVR